MLIIKQCHDIDRLKTIRKAETGLKDNAIKVAMKILKAHYKEKYQKDHVYIKTNAGFKLISKDNDKTLPIIKVINTRKKINKTATFATDDIAEPVSDITVVKQDHQGFTKTIKFFKIKPTEQPDADAMILTKEDVGLIRKCSSQNSIFHKFRIFRLYNMASHEISYSIKRNPERLINGCETFSFTHDVIITI